MCNDRYDIGTLEQDARDAAREARQYSGDLTNVAHDIANELTPVYTYDILQYAANDLALATDEPGIGPAFGGAPTPVNIIAANIYERLFAAAYDELAQDED